MKKIVLFINLFMLIFLAYTPPCAAEKIHYKDGRILTIPITSRSLNYISVKDKWGERWISLQNITKIENEDGTLSKFDFEGINELLQSSVREKNYPETLDYCNLLAESFPNNAEIRYLRGSLNQKIGNFDEAIQDYQLLIKQKTADAKILNNLGTIYASNNLYEEAKNCFIEATIKDPNLAEAHDNLAEVFLQSKNYGRAIDEYNRVIKLEPENLRALFNLGIAYINTGEDTLAETQWKQILSINPEDQDAKDALEFLAKSKQIETDITEQSGGNGEE